METCGTGGSCNLIMRKDKKTQGIDGGQVSYSKKPCGRGTVAFMSCNNGCSFVGYDPTITVLTASCDNDNNGMIGWRFPKDRQPYCDCEYEGLIFFIAYIACQALNGRIL